MKKLMAFMSLIGLIQRGQAQTFAEWFEQNKTELKYLRAQLIALEAEDDELNDGFTVDETGLLHISVEKQADLDQHQAYFNELDSPNFRIAMDPRAEMIVTLTIETQKLIARAKEIVDSSPTIQDGFDNVLNHFGERCVTGLSTLKDLLQNGVLQLTDSERLSRLSQLYDSTKNLNDLAWQVWRDARYYSKYESQ